RGRSSATRERQNCDEGNGRDEAPLHQRPLRIVSPETANSDGGAPSGRNTLASSSTTSASTLVPAKALEALKLRRPRATVASAPCRSKKSGSARRPANTFIEASAGAPPGPEHDGCCSAPPSP